MQLTSGEVIADDGPASGFSYKPNLETLSPGIEIRKQLVISDPRASKAVLLIGQGGSLKVKVNGVCAEIGSSPQDFLRRVAGVRLRSGGAQGGSE